MRHKKLPAKLIVLIGTFIPSLSVFWDIVSIVNGESKFYSVFQLMFASYYTLISIFSTYDNELFKKFWREHRIPKAIFDKALHLSAAFLTWFVHLSLLIPECVSIGNRKKDIEACKQNAKKQIHEFDNMPIEARTIVLAGTISLILLLIVIMDICSDRCLALIQDGLSAVVSIVGLFFVILNAKEYQNSGE